AAIADASMGPGGASTARSGRSVPIVKSALDEAGRDPDACPISRRVFMSAPARADVARAELDRWFTVVYRNPAGTDASGVHGTPEEVRRQLEDLVDSGANHLLLNPVCRYAEQVDALASLAGLP